MKVKVITAFCKGGGVDLYPPQILNVPGDLTEQEAKVKIGQGFVIEVPEDHEEPADQDAKGKTAKAADKEKGGAKAASRTSDRDRRPRAATGPPGPRRTAIMTDFARSLIHAVTTQLEAVLSRTSTLTGTAFDVSAYEGTAMITLAAGAATAGTNPTLNVKIQHADTATGSFTDVTDAAFDEVTDTAGVQTLFLDLNKVKAFIKVIGTLGGTNSPAFPYGAAFTGIKKYS